MDEVLKKSTESGSTKIKKFSINNPLLAPFILTILGFLESFVISGVFFPSLFLYLLAVFLFVEQISSLFLITLFAYVGSFIGDQSSYLMGRIFGTKFLIGNFSKKEMNVLKKQKYGLTNMNLSNFTRENDPKHKAICTISSRVF